MTRRLDEQEGAVIVTFAISLVLFMLVTSFAIDASNFFRHKRQLQNQADAAVLAGASKLTQGCSDNSAVITEATKYAGISGSTYNKPKVSGESGTLVANWVTPAPCTSGALEVEIAENDTKWFFPITAVAGVLRSGLDIKASARVELKQIIGQGATLPVGFEEESKVTNAWTWLVDESNASILIPGTVKRLAKGTGSSTTAPWTTTTPITHNVTQSAIGVRVAVDYATVSACATVTDGCAALCGVGKVKCYDSANGLLHIHGFEQKTAPVVSPPMLTDVQISTPTPCASPNPYFNRNSGCNYVVTAKVDWVPEIDNPAFSMSKVDGLATVAGTLGGVAIALHPTGDSHTWVGNATLSTAGPSDLKLGWTQTDGSVSAAKACGKKTGTNGQITNTPGGNNTPVCKGSWRGDGATGLLDLVLGSATPVHRVFIAGTAQSGSITAATVTDGGATSYANSVTKCAIGVFTCTHSFTVSIDLPADLQLGSHRNISTSQSGSNDGFLDCDPLHQDPNSPTSNGKPRFIYQITYGCNGPRFAVNPGDTCPAINSYAAGQPWICVASVTGTKKGALDEGLTKRIYGTTSPTTLDCTTHPNRMKTGYTTAIPADDTRVVSVMLVPSNALSLSGGTLFPVRTFAYFYLTGWDKQNSCSDQETSADGDVLGYFMKYTHPNDGGVFGTAACDPQALGGCVPVMTK